jgi:hypothetical protein
MSTFQLPKTSLEAIPILKGKSNYNTWAKQMESHLRASRAWLIIEGRWTKPNEPSYFEAPVRLQDIIEEHRAKHQAVAVESDQDTATSSTVDPTTAAEPSASAPYVPMTIEEAKEERECIRTEIERWNKWETVERTGINDINSRISETCREELGSLVNLVNIWAKLRTLYVESTVGTWVRELNAITKLRGSRKEGENPDDWIRKVKLRIQSAEENLGELSFKILGAYIISVDLGSDITTTITETYRQRQWPSLDDLGRSISEEYQSKLNTGKTKPTVSARPSNEDPKLNLTQRGQKRKGESLSSSSEKKQETSRAEGKRKELPVCPICNAKHPIREEGQCYLAKPETAPVGWRERNKERIEAFKKSK